MLPKSPMFWTLAVVDCGGKSVETNDATLSNREF